MMQKNEKSLNCIYSLNDMITRPRNVGNLGFQWLSTFNFTFNFQRGQFNLDFIGCSAAAMQLCCNYNCGR